MQFTIERQALLGALTRVSGIVGRRSTIPILACVVLTAVDGALVIKASNLDMEATVRAPCRVETEGETCVNADALLNIAKSAAEGADISFELQDRLHVKSGRSRYKLAILPPVDFPVFGDMDEAPSLEITREQLAALLRPSFAMGTDQGRLYLCGVSLFVRDGELICIGTDGHRLAMATMPAIVEDFSAIVPAPMVNEMQRLATTAAEIMLTVSKAKIQCVTSDTTLIGKLIDFQFADYRHVIPKEIAQTVRMDGDAAMNSIRRAMIGASDTSHSARLEIEGDTMRLTARTLGGDIDAADETEVEYVGEPIKIGVNADHLLQAINAADADMIEIGFSPGKGPTVIRSVADDRLLSLVMPLKV